MARFVFNEIELTDYVGTHPAIDNGIPAEVQLGGLRRDALAVFLEGQGSPREICVLLAYLLRACGVPTAIAECAGGSVYLLDQDFSRIIGRNIGQAELTPEKIPVKYPWLIALVDKQAGTYQHLFPG